MLQKGVADYELAQTFPADSPERKKALAEALAQFESMYKSYRTQFAGLAAQMYQAKCYEEQGNVDAAIGIYKQLMEHGDPRLRDLQRNVGYFYIVALAKRKQYRPGGRRGGALAGDLQPARRAAVARRAGRLDGAGQEHRGPDGRSHDRRASQGGQPHRRRRRPGRAVRLAVQERRDGAAQEIQAERGRAGRRDRQAQL